MYPLFAITPLLADFELLADGQLDQGAGSKLYAGADLQTKSRIRYLFGQYGEAFEIQEQFAKQVEEQNRSYFDPEVMAVAIQASKSYTALLSIDLAEKLIAPIIPKRESLDSDSKFTLRTIEATHFAMKGRQLEAVRLIDQTIDECAHQVGPIAILKATLLKSGFLNWAGRYDEAESAANEVMSLARNVVGSNSIFHFVASYVISIALYGRDELNLARKVVDEAIIMGSETKFPEIYIALAEMQALRSRNYPQASETDLKYLKHMESVFGDLVMNNFSELYVLLQVFWMSNFGAQPDIALQYSDLLANKWRSPDYKYPVIDLQCQADWAFVQSGIELYRNQFSSVLSLTQNIHKFRSERTGVDETPTFLALIHLVAGYAINGMSNELTETADRLVNAIASKYGHNSLEIGRNTVLLLTLLMTNGSIEYAGNLFTRYEDSILELTKSEIDYEHFANLLFGMNLWFVVGYFYNSELGMQKLKEIRSFADKFFPATEVSKIVSSTTDGFIPILRSRTR